MAETGDDETSHGPPPRPSPPKRKRESLVIQGTASEAGPLGAPAAAPWGRRAMLAAGALALAALWLFAARPDLGPLDRRTAALDAGADQTNARLAALEADAQLAAAERHALAVRLKAAPDAEAKLADRLAALQGAGDKTAAGSRDLQSAVEMLKRDVAATSARLKAASDAEASLAARLAALEGVALRPDALAPVAAEARAAKQAADKALAAAPADPNLDRLATDEAEIAALRDRLDKLTTPKAVTRVSPAAPTADPSAAARLVAAMELQSRLDAGAPLGPTLAALDRIGVSAEALAPLRAYAETGAPTLAALARALDQAMPAPRFSPAPGVAQRWLGEVQGLIKVRKVGESRGNEAKLSPVKAALGAGDLAGALAAFADLPPTAQAAARSWRASAQARLAAGRAAEAIFGHAVAALGARR